MSIGRNIRYYRKKAGLTQQELAIKIGISRPGLGNYEGGGRTPNSVHICAIAKALNVSIDALFSEELPLTLGEKIVNARLKKGLNQKELADILNITPASIARYENNKREPNLSTLSKISDVLEIDISDLVRMTSQTQQEKCIDIKNLNTQELTNLIMEATKELSSRVVIK